MQNLFYALGMPTRFIRYNPDKYKGERVLPSKRKQVLLDWLIHYMETEPEDEYLRALYLFYDGYDSYEPNIVDINVV